MYPTWWEKSCSLKTKRQEANWSSFSSMFHSSHNCLTFCCTHLSSFFLILLHFPGGNLKHGWKQVYRLYKKDRVSFCYLLGCSVWPIISWRYAINSTGRGWIKGNSVLPERWISYNSAVVLFCLWHLTSLRSEESAGFPEKNSCRTGYKTISNQCRSGKFSFCPYAGLQKPINSLAWSDLTLGEYYASSIVFQEIIT